MAYIIDMIVSWIYIFVVSSAWDGVHVSHDWKAFVMVTTVFIPAFTYTFLCETFLNGQTLGKYIMRIKVVRTDGTAPGIGDFFMRWILRTIDIGFFMIGFFFMLFSKNNQRFGDLAAGTVVIKIPKCKALQRLAGEYQFAQKDYAPLYPEVQVLSTGQVEIIHRTLDSYLAGGEGQINPLAAKVEQTLGVKHREEDNASFLHTVINDYRYYMLESV